MRLQMTQHYNCFTSAHQNKCFFYVTKHKLTHIPRQVKTTNMTALKIKLKKYGNINSSIQYSVILLIWHPTI